VIRQTKEVYVTLSACVLTSCKLTKSKLKVSVLQMNTTSNFVIEWDWI